MARIEDLEVGTRVRRVGKVRMAVLVGDVGVVVRKGHYSVTVEWDRKELSECTYEKDRIDTDLELEATPKPPAQPLFVGDSGWRA